MSKERIGIDPKIKKEINEEGWEKTDDRDEQALLVGKPEEMPQLLERLENEGRTENLGTYIKMHKEIVLPKEEMSQELRERIKSGLRGLFFYTGNILTYIDKDGNIADVEIDSEKISSMRNSVRGIQEQVKDELESLGFFQAGKSMSVTQMDSNEILRKISQELGKYKRKIEKEIQERKKEEFDF